MSMYNEIYKYSEASKQMAGKSFVLYTVFQIEPKYMRKIFWSF